MAKKENVIKIEKVEGVYQIYANGIFVRTVTDIKGVLVYCEWLQYANPMEGIVFDAGYLLPEIIKYQEEKECQTSNC